MFDISKFIKLKDTLPQGNWLDRIRDYSFLIGESAVDLGINLVIMIMVERSLGTAGLGIFSFLLSIIIFAGFLSDFGLSSFLEREISVSPENSHNFNIIEKTFHAILLTSTICTVLFIFTALSDTTLTKIDEKAIAYFIIAITIPIRNINRIRIAILQGEGKFDTTAKLKTWKRVYLFLTVFFFVIWHLPASLTISAYFISEFGLFLKSKKVVNLPSLKILWGRKPFVGPTLQQGVPYLLTDEMLDIVLYLDFFLLGFFVSSLDLGLYAEASILARIFLIVPMSIKPAFRNRYCSLLDKRDLQSIAYRIKQSTALLFFFHSVLALIILLYYQLVMKLFYQYHRINEAPFHIFVEFLPGLLFFSAITAQDSLYEADGKIAILQKNIIWISILNLILNCFCIPFAGYYGAAFATSASMFVYFLLFAQNLSSPFGIHKLKYLCAGCAVYLTYILFKELSLSFVLSFFLVPAFLFILFLTIGIFDFHTDKMEFS